MSNETDKIIPEMAFPPGIPLPPKLKALTDAVNAGTFDYYHLSGSFELSFEPVGDMVPWFARPATPSAKYAAEQLACFGHGPDGSVFAIWKAPAGGFPVVYLGSEGDTCVLAADFDQFLRLLAVSYGELGPGEWDEPPETVDEDWEDAINPAFQQWVRAQGLDVPEIGADIVSAAALAYPDFSGWCDEAVAGTLSAETAKAAPLPKAGDGAKGSVPAGADLWTLMVSAIGQRIDAPVVSALTEAIGARPLKPATPGNATYATVKAFGMEITAISDPKIRACWPPRKEARVWVTYLYRIELDSRYAGPLPPGIHFGMSKEELDAIGSFHLRGAVKTPYWLLPAPREGVVLEAEVSPKRPAIRLWLRMSDEIAYITTRAEYENEKPLAYVEDAFFAVWCALNGLLRPDRFSPEVMDQLRERRVTPLQFLNGACGRLLWSGDLRPEFQEFMMNYYQGLLVPDKKRWVTDIKTVFGQSNHYRREGEAMTQDSWKNFDRIAPHITRRLGEWRRGELNRAG